MLDKRKQYWPFFWPLALTGLAMILAAQFKNGVLSRYPEAVSEIAIFAIAASIFQFCNAGIIFVPQMANVLSRSPEAARICVRFILLAALCLSLPVLSFAFTPLGELVVPLLFNMRGEWLERVLFYLQLLSPMIVINALRFYLTGLLIQSRRTGWVTILNGIMLGATVLVLLFGLAAQMDPVLVITGSFVLPALIHLLLTWLVYMRNYESPALDPDAERLTYKRALQFFYPVAFTSSMFALSRPIIYGFVSHTENAVLTIAVLRIVFDFTMIFYNVLNQFRHLFVTFGAEDREGVRNFMLRVFTVVLIVMLIVCLSPIHAWILYYLLGIKDLGHIQMAQEAMLVLCAIPVFLTLRNYYHGLAMLQRKTGSMGISGILRILSITAVVAIAQASDSLNHVTAAAALVAGFMAEGISMCWLSRRRDSASKALPA